MKKFTFIISSLVLGSIALTLFNFQLPSFSGPENPDPALAPFEKLETKGWYRAKAGQKLTTKALVVKNKAYLGLSNYDQLEFVRTQKDEAGYVHHRYEQYHRGVKVDASQIIVHEVNGEVESFNGAWAPELDKVASPKLSANQAIQYALNYAPAHQYLWESEMAQKMLQKAMKDPQATFYPNAELVWFDPTFSQDPEAYRLAYAMEVQAMVPHFRMEMYVDAETGMILHQLNSLEHTNAEGTALTKYSGLRPITSDSISPTSFRLREPNRNGSGAGIFTYDLNQTTNYNTAVDFFDDDNNWANFNADFDEVATDAHWAAEVVHDLLIEKFGWTGVNGNGMDFICYIHFDTLGLNGQPSRNYVNAFWNGAFATFGDGDAATSPLTDLDVVAHEFGHGLDQFSSNFRYRGESGALDESYADIWGATMEFWAAAEQADWNIGEDSDRVGFGLRSMSDPNRESDPDTYDGRFWGNPDCENPGAQDNCFVHTNSGVQNFWYYLLVEGGSGINDHDEPYDITGLGLETAAQIAWRAQHSYLFRDATYADARMAGLMATIQMFGECSTEYITVANAWNAVGVGNGIFENDLQANQIKGYSAVNCGLSDQELPTFQLNNRACSPNLMPGDQVPVAAQVDGGVIVRDTITLAQAISGLDSMDVTFTKGIPGLETAGMHELRIWTEFPNDGFLANDTTSIELENIIEQESDFATNSAPPLESDCFLGEQSVSMQVLFLGCSMIPAGAELDFYYSANGGTPVKETTTLPNALLRGQTYNYTFTTPLDLDGQLGTNKVDFWVELEDDFLNENDTLLAQIARNPHLLLEERLITFEEGETSLDSVHFVTTEQSAVMPATSSRFEGPNILEMTGGDFDALLASNLIQIPSESNIWSSSMRRVSAQACFCIDATSVIQPELHFDLRQSFSRSWQAVHGAENPFASAARVLVDGDQVSDSYFPETRNSDEVGHITVDLSDYEDSVFELCIESRCGYSPEDDPFTSGDKVHIDNILIRGQSGAVNITPELAGIQVFPNPTTDRVNVTLNNATQEEVSLNVYDVFGKVVESIDARTLSQGNSREVSLNGLPAGNYYFHFTSNQGQRIEKVVLF